MKRNTTFIFAGIMSAIIGNAYATGENRIASKSYTDTKQTKIPVGNLTISDGGKFNFSVPHTLVSTPTITPGEIGEYGILDNDLLSLTDISDDVDLSSMFRDGLYGNLIPNVDTINRVIDFRVELMQRKIPKSGFRAVGFTEQYNNDPYGNTGWLSANIKGTGLVTRTSTDGVVGERKIFEASDVSGYHDTNLTQNEKDIQDISIPTVGAMMTAISNGVNAATPTGTPNTIANYGANGELDSGIATYTGAAAYNATNDSAKIPTMAGVTTYAQAKKTCAGWPDGTTTYDATHTDANCWLWTFPD